MKVRKVVDKDILPEPMKWNLTFSFTIREAYSRKTGVPLEYRESFL